MDKFKFLTGDVNYKDYGGKWYRQINESVYHVIELVNMWEATGEENQPKYNVELSEIDLDNVSDKNMDAALSYCGWSDNQLDTVSDLMKVDSLSSYGIFAPMGQWDGMNYNDLMKQARAESHRLESDQDYRETQLERPVNKIGSTAREFAAGDTTSAMIRSIANGDIAGRILGKMHGLNEKDLQDIASDPNNKDFSLTS